MTPYCSAILLMGGEGKRVGTPVPKQFQKLGSRMVYQHTLQKFQESGCFQEIILVCPAHWYSEVQEAGVKVVIGGETRQASSLQGLKACHPECHYVMIHDAVRPFVSLEIIRNNIEAVVTFSAVDTCIAAIDTVVITKNGMTIDSIPLRSEFRQGQTPQTFSYGLIRKAHAMTKKQNATDDCQLVLDLGIEVAIIEGSPENFKITTEWDLALARKMILSTSVSGLFV